MTIGERLKQARQHAGLSQPELAERSGVKQQVISKIESGRQQSTSFAVDLAVACGVRPEWLANDQGPMVAEGFYPATEQRQGLEAASSPKARPDAIDVPVMNAAGSMGGGLTAPELDAIVGRMRLATGWIRRNLTTISRPSNLAVLTAYGDSMSPTFNNGDMLLVDTGVTDLKLDAVYVLDREGELFIKRVQRRLDGALVIRSDNPLYDSFVMEPSELARLRVLGRVVWAWNGRSL